MAVGYHIIADFYGVDPKILDDPEKIREIFDKASVKAKFNVLYRGFKKFEPQGLSAIYYLAESHLSIHTWPEYGLATIDIYTCGSKESCLIAYDILKEEFKPKKIEEYFFERGKEVNN